MEGMAETDKGSRESSRISDKERFRYIGFEVFPGTPKDLFKNQAEKDKFVESVRTRRQSDETLRDACTLMEERVSGGERLVLAVASVVMFLALFLPWYSAYVERQEQVPAQPQAAINVEVEAVQPDSLAAKVGDSLTAALPAQAGQPAATAGAGTSHQGQRANEEIITQHQQRKKVVKDVTRVSGLGAFALIGSAGGYVFSSGFVLILTALLMIVYGLLCIALPAANLYTLYGLKGTPEERALRLKKQLRHNWIPLIILVVVFLLSLVGADYGFNPADTYTSVGNSYGIATIFNTLSLGIFVALAASILVAVKGVEI